MTSVRVEIDAEDIRDGLAPVWRWRVLIDSQRVAEGVEPFLSLAHQRASASLLAAL